MTSINALAYARVSRDRSERERSINEQLKEIREECDRRGWHILEEITDNSISASRYTTKERPGYRRVIQQLATGNVDVLVVWESSRTGRRLEDHIELRKLCEATGVQLCARNKLIDFSDPYDRADAARRAIDSELETDLTAERIRRNVRNRAQSGDPHSVLPWGYRKVYDATGRKHWEPDPESAPLVRDLVRRILGGESLYSIARDWNAKGITTSTGRAWEPRLLRQTALRPAYAALRQFQGEVIGEGTWEPLISVDEHRAVVTVLRDPQRRSNVSKPGPKPIRLLSGIAVCGVCGETVRYMKSKGKAGQYRCTAGHVGRRAEDVDAIVTARMFELIEKYRANTWLMADDDAHHDTHMATALFEQADVLQARILEATAEFEQGHITAATLGRIEQSLTTQIAELRERAVELTPDPALLRLAHDAGTLWDTFSMEQKRKVVRSLLRVEIHTAGRRGQRVVDPETVRVERRTLRR